MFNVLELYLHCFMVAFVVRFSICCFVTSGVFFTQNDPFILKLNPLIVTIIVYCVLCTKY